jgi:hypothetical protein
MWIVTILSTLSIGIVKCSAILLYRRIFTISRIFNYYTTVLLVLIVTWTLAFLTASIFLYFNAARIQLQHGQTEKSCKNTAMILRKRPPHVHSLM